MIMTWRVADSKCASGEGQSGAFEGTNRCESSCGGSKQKKARAGEVE